MATFNCPVTGITLNVISVRRTGRVSADERRCAQALLDSGVPRWEVASHLGRHPLTFNGSGRAPIRPKARPAGRNLRLSDARADTRQIGMDDLLSAKPAEGTND